MLCRMTSLLQRLLTRCDASLSRGLRQRHFTRSFSGSNGADENDPLPVARKKRAGGVGEGPSGATAIPTESDVVIIGGAAIGMSTAFWLKQLLGNSCSVTLIERDFTYSRAATVLSNGAIRQQYSIPENVEMSLFSADFLRNIKEHLSVLGVDPPDVSLNSHGYLFLATKDGEQVMRENYQTQVSAGAKVELLTEPKLREKFPWLQTDDLVLGSYGLANEGWFDPWQLLSAFKTKASSLGVQFVSGNVTGFGSSPGSSQPDRVIVSSLRGGIQSHAIRFGRVVNCGGPWSRDVARLAGIGTGSGSLAVDLPVEPRKRYIFMFHCPTGPGIQTPMLIDSTGVFVRREGHGGNYVCGASPPPGSEPDTSSLDVDYEFFNEFVWPRLAQRVPAFESLKLKSAWAGFYDFNYFDHNLIIGAHPSITNFYVATGCSGHGIMHSPAVGHAMAELLAYGRFKTIDLTRMSFDRIIQGTQLLEKNVI